MTRANSITERPAWKINIWHWCRHYAGLGKRARCGTGVWFEDVAVAVCKFGRGAEKRYPCCLEWGGPDSCDKREIEGDGDA